MIKIAFILKIYQTNSQDETNYHYKDIFTTFISVCTFINQYKFVPGSVLH